MRCWVQEHQPKYVIHVAGKVGGILANSQYPADFLYDNLLVHATVLRAAHESCVQKLLYLGSSCVYPRDCPQPVREEYLLTGPLEETNYAYAIAKIAGPLSCHAYRQQFGCQFISAMPTNLYGPRTTSISKDRMSFPPCCANSTKRLAPTPLALGLNISTASASGITLSRRKHRFLGGASHARVLSVWAFNRF